MIISERARELAATIESRIEKSLKAMGLNIQVASVKFPELIKNALDAHAAETEARVREEAWPTLPDGWQILSVIRWRDTWCAVINGHNTNDPTYRGDGESPAEAIRAAISNIN